MTIRTIFKATLTLILLFFAGRFIDRFVSDVYDIHENGMTIFWSYLVATLCFVIIWILPQQRPSQLKQTINLHTPEKTKRTPVTSRYELLLDLMDEDEREAFKQQLKQQILDNETPDLTIWENFFSEENER